MPFPKSRIDIEVVVVNGVLYHETGFSQEVIWPWFLYETKTAVSFILSFDCGYV